MKTELAVVVNVESGVEDSLATQSSVAVVNGGLYTDHIALRAFVGGKGEWLVVKSEFMPDVERIVGKNIITAEAAGVGFEECGKGVLEGLRAVLSLELECRGTLGGPNSNCKFGSRILDRIRFRFPIRIRPSPFSLVPFVLSHVIPGRVIHILPCGLVVLPLLRLAWYITRTVLFVEKHSSLSSLVLALLLSIKLVQVRAVYT
jgi:hypothetical protein